MALIGLPHAAQRLLSATIKSDRHGGERHFDSVRADRPVAFKIQADLDRLRMKTLTPIKRLMRLEIMPFEADARGRHASVQRHPTSAKLLPGRALGKN